MKILTSDSNQIKIKTKSGEILVRESGNNTTIRLAGRFEIAVGPPIQKETESSIDNKLPLGGPGSTETSGHGKILDAVQYPDNAHSDNMQNLQGVDKAKNYFEGVVKSHIQKDGYCDISRYFVEKIIKKLDKSCDEQKIIVVFDHLCAKNNWQYYLHQEDLHVQKPGILNPPHS